MIYILVSKKGNQYPYSLAMLRNSFPNTSFPEVITEEIAKEFGCYPVAFTDRPECDPRGERTEETEPTLTKNGWVQSWVTREATQEEIDQYDMANKAGPDWDGFKFSLLSNQEINAGLIASISIAPAATIGIVPSLINAESGKYGDFRAAWLTLRRCGALTKESADLVTALASECNLPEDFIRLLR